MLIFDDFGLQSTPDIPQKCNLENPGSDGVPMAIPTIEGIIPDQLLKDGDLLTAGKVSFKTIHTPGHTPGGVCFYCREEK